MVNCLDVTPDKLIALSIEAGQRIIGCRCCFKHFKEEKDQLVVQSPKDIVNYNNPVTALLEFKPNFYDLLLVDIMMPPL